MCRIFCDLAMFFRRARAELRYVRSTPTTVSFVADELGEYIVNSQSRADVQDARALLGWSYKGREVLSGRGVHEGRDGCTIMADGLKVTVSR